MECMFIGKDGSMGLIKGNIYSIRTIIAHNLLWVHWDNNGCPYSNLENFLKNWKVVQSDG